jgi:HEAT repeat protein/cyclophilin family peptidyl-prolyl cis-trans isomerase
VTRTTIALTLALGASACASAPPAPSVTPKIAEPSFEQKMSWILRLEDTRVLRDPAPIPPPAAAPVAAPAPAPGRGRTVAPAPSPPEPIVPDLIRMLSDREARIRRRAAFAVGRVGLSEGVAALVPILADPDPEVRQVAAFALGLIGDPSARQPLVAALADPSPLMKGSAAEALGLIGDAADAPAIAAMMRDVLGSGALAATPSDTVDAVRDSPAAAFRLGLFALTRLKTYDALAGVVLEQSGQPRVRWWPVAFALARLEDPRAGPALLTLLSEEHPYTRAFAARGLGAVKERSAAAGLVRLVTGADRNVAVEAIRALGRIGDRAAAVPLMKLVQNVKSDPALRLEAVSALASIHADGVYETLLDVLGDSSIPVRGAALTSVARLDPDGFVAVLSGLDPDPNWTVRASLASALGFLPPEIGVPRLRSMLADQDRRVIPAVLESLTKLAPRDAAAILFEQLKSDDPVIRAAAAGAIASIKPSGGAEALADAYRRSLNDPTYESRAAVLAALRAYGSEAAQPILTDALADKDWGVRVRAAQLLTELDPASDAKIRIRPAPTVHDDAWYGRVALTEPPVSTQVFVDTDRGTIQLELAVLDAPITVDNFVTLARRGFFDGLPVHRVVPDYVIQAGDPRGDSEGGPGYTIRDEINERTYLRGTVGMALDAWRDTGGSQFFITHSPQPQLDDRYTIFGRVIQGMEIVDAIQPWDIVRRVRVWDGTGTN